MYQVKPVCGGIRADLPSCMYKLTNIHQPAATAQPCQNGEADPAILALETRQDDIMRKLYELKAAVEGLAKTVATPDADLDSCSLAPHASHAPSSSSSSPFRLTEDLDALLGKGQLRRKRFQLGFTLIWKDVPQLQMKFSVQNMCAIEGEASVARFLYRLLAPYPSDAGAATLVDSWVDTAFWRLAQGGGAKEHHALAAALGSHGAWLCGPEPTLADIACYCCTMQGARQSKVDMSASPANVQGWLKACDNLGHFDGIKLLLQ